MHVCMKRLDDRLDDSVYNLKSRQMQKKHHLMQYGTCTQFLPKRFVFLAFYSLSNGIQYSTKRIRCLGRDVGVET